MKSVFSYQPGQLPTLPLYLQPVTAGFPSPADDFLDNKLDLNDFLIKHPAATFFLRVSTNAMKGAGIFAGDVLIVDRSLEPADNAIIVAVLEDELLIKRIKYEKKGITLLSAHPQYEPILISEERDFRLWGVVTSVIHQCVK